MDKSELRYIQDAYEDVRDDVNISISLTLENECCTDHAVNLQQIVEVLTRALKKRREETRGGSGLLKMIQPESQGIYIRAETKAGNAPI